MTGPDALRAYQALYRPGPRELRDRLPAIAEGLSTQLHELYARTSADRCDRVLVNLEGTRQHVLRLRERLIAEGESGAP